MAIMSEAEDYLQCRTDDTDATLLAFFSIRHSETAGNTLRSSDCAQGDRDGMVNLYTTVKLMRA